MGNATSLFENVAKKNYPAVCITDHGNVFGGVKYTQAARKVSVKYVMGEELYYSPMPLDTKPNLKKGDNADDWYAHLCVFVESQKGYENLCALSYHSWVHGFYRKNRVDIELLKKHHEGLIFTSGCLAGPVSNLILRGDIPAAEKQLCLLRDTVGKENFYIEIQHHPFEDQVKVNKVLKMLARNLGMEDRYLYCMDSHYLDKKDSFIHSCVLCVSTRSKLADTNRPLQFHPEEFHIKTQKEVLRLNLEKDFPGCLENTLELAKRCNFSLTLKGDPGWKIQFPKFPTPEGYDSDKWLNRLIKIGLKEKAEQISEHRKLKGLTQQDYEDRIKYEVGIIRKTGFVDYFLFVSDMMKYVKKKKIYTDFSRGSVAGSIVAYLTDITEVDSLRWEIPFERFLGDGTEERISPPDIDIDLSHAKHHKVVSYLKKKYGKNRICQIATFSVEHGRQAISDAARILDIPFQKAKSYSKLVPYTHGKPMPLKEAVEKIPDLQKAAAIHPEWFSIALGIEGINRHASVHAAGYIIAPHNLRTHLPLFAPKADKKGDRVISCQFDMNDLEALGYIKVDLLRVKTLDVVENCIKSTKKNINMFRLPLDDKKAFKILRTGKTDGVFQMASDLMKRILKDFKPRLIEDIAMVNALARPGAEQGLDQVLAVRNGQAEPKYLFSALEPILKSTFGSVVYQEQVVAAARAIGCSYVEGEKIRKAMGKKVAADMDAMQSVFMKNGIKNKFNKEKLQEMWTIFADAASYNFNYGHSIGYSLLTYVTAWLKANYPKEFMAALMTSDMNDKDKLASHIQAATDMGIKILPYDINKSMVRFKPERDGIRLGLGALDGIGPAAAAMIRAIRRGVDERKRYGYYFTEY